MLEVYDRELKKIAILENALNVSEEENINAVSYFNFSLPYNDVKNKYCRPFYFVRLDNGPFYRLMLNSLERNEMGMRTYRCEHAIVTLIDKNLFGYHAVGGKSYYTSQVIKYVLDRQLVRHWELGICEFNRQFEYGWEQENLLSALFSIPNCFAEDYIWDFDFSAYPWKVSLKQLNKAGKPDLYVRNNRNLQSLNVVSDPTALCTRLYPLGYGEGVNQLNIAEVNNGVKYIQSPKEYTDKYGIIEKVWTDRRYEDANSLLAAAQAMLAELQEPAMQNTVTFNELGISRFEQVKIGGIVRIIDTETETDIKTYITNLNRKYDDVLQSEITVANKATDIASSIADLADRQRIEMTYSQGATNLYSQSLQGNADKENGLKLNFFIPAEMRIVNKVQAKIQIDSFRAYSKATLGGGGFFGTTEDGGGFYDTTESGGGISDSTDSGGGDYATSGVDSYGGSSAGGHNHGISSGTRLAVWVGSNEDGLLEGGGYVTWVKSGNHTHTVQIPAHRHSFDVPSHRHNVEIDEHAHDIDIEEHEHEITPGIFEFGNPSAFTVFVNGFQKTIIQETGADIDLTGYLVEDGSIPRGIWHEIEIRPNDLAYISIDMFVQGFIQSRGNNTV